MATHESTGIIIEATRVPAGFCRFLEQKGHVALATADAIMGSRPLEESRRHARDLAPKVRELLREAGASRLGDEDALITSGRVDSMGLLQILGYIQQRYSVDLMAVGNPQDFDTVKALAAAVRRNQRSE